MPPAVKCTCPKPYPPFRELGNGLARCTACGRLKTAPAAPRKIPWGKWILGGALGLIIPMIALMGAWQFLFGRSFQLAREEYAERAVPPLAAGVDEPKIEAKLRELFAAIQSRLGGTFANCFSIRRALAEIEARGGDVLVVKKRDEEALEEELSLALGTLCGELEMKKWKGMIHHAIRLDPAKGEAEATCLVKLKEPRTYFHLRFWLIKEGSEWGIYDFEDLDGRLRLSRTLGRAAKSINPMGAVWKTQQAQQLFDQASALIAQGKVEESLDVLRKASAAAKGTPLEMAAARNEAEVLAVAGRKEEALRMFDQLLATRKGLLWALSGKAALLEQQGRKPEALTLFQEALSNSGENPNILSNIARLQDELGKSADATAAYRRAAGLVREDPDLAIDLGFALLKRGSRKEAAALLIDAADDSEDHFVRAADQLRLARSADELAKVLASNKNDALAPGEVPLFHGAMLRLTGKTAEAEAMLRKGMLDASPENSLFYMEETSLALSSLGRTEDALKLADQVRAAEGWEPKGRFLRACALAKGKPEEALKELREALKGDPTLALSADHEPLLKEINPRRR